MYHITSDLHGLCFRIFAMEERETSPYKLCKKPLNHQKDETDTQIDARLN